MEGQRRDVGSQRWRPSGSGVGSGGGSSEPVSSYASLASGPPPSYARHGNADSWDFDDKQQQSQRPPSPQSPYTRKGPPSFGGGGGFRGGRTGRGGRYDSGNERGSGGRGRSFRGGRDRSGRGYDRFSDGQQHSQDRFHSSSADRNSNSGYESGEIMPISRSSSSHRRMEERGNFEGRGSRSNASEGRGRGGRFFSRGGRDSSRVGRGQRAGGRFFERGGRGGRSTYRGRGRGNDGTRDSHKTGSEWIPGGGRATPDDLHRLPGPDAGGRGEGYNPRGDERLSPRGNSFGGRGRGAGGRGLPRYDSFGSDHDFPPSRHPESLPEDRFSKRRREEHTYGSMDYEEKRMRDNDFVPWNRNMPQDEIRPSFSVKAPPAHTPMDVAPSPVEMKPPFSDQISESRLVDPRGSFQGDQRTDLATQQQFEDTRGGSSQIHEDPRGPPMHRDDPRGGISMYRDDERAGAGAGGGSVSLMTDDVRASSTIHRDQRSGHAAPSSEDPRSSNGMHRDDPRSSLILLNDESRGLGAMHRDDPRAGVSMQHREDLVGGIQTPIHDTRGGSSTPRDFRVDDPRTSHEPRHTIQEDGIRRDASTRCSDPRQDFQGVDDLYQDMPSMPTRGADPRSDRGVDPRSDRGADPRSERGLDPRSDRVLDPRNDRGLDPRSDRGLDPRSDRGPEPRNDRGLDPRSDRGLDSRNDRGLDPRIDRGLDPRSERSVDPRSERGIDPRSDRGQDPRTDRGLDPRTDRAQDPRGERGLDPRNDRGLDARVDRGLDPRIDRGPDNHTDFQGDGYARDHHAGTGRGLETGREIQGGDDFRRDTPTRGNEPGNEYQSGGLEGFRRGSGSNHNFQGSSLPRETDLRDNQGSTGTWPPVAQPAFSKAPFAPQQQSIMKINSWTALQGNRSPMPSPSSIRRTHVVPGAEHGTNLQEGEPNLPPPPLLERGRGRGRGRGYRGRGRSEFGRGSGRGPNESNRPLFTSLDSSESHLARQRGADQGWKRRNESSGEESGVLRGSTPTEEQSWQQHNVQQPPQPKQLRQKLVSEKQQSPTVSNKKEELNSVSQSKSASPPPVMEEPEMSPSTPSVPPPPVGPASGIMLAMARLADLEAQMEYAYAKHMQLVNRHERIQAQVEVLQKLPVGIEAFQEDLAKLILCKQAGDTG